jgi:hypothetical protein
MLSGKLPYEKALSARNIKRVHYIPAQHYNSDIPAWLNGALAKAVHLNPEQRYSLLSEFNYDLCHPNKSFLKKNNAPLVERSPVVFWKILTMLLLVINFLLIYILSSTNL